MPKFPEIFWGKIGELGTAIALGRISLISLISDFLSSRIRVRAPFLRKSLFSLYLGGWEITDFTDETYREGGCGPNSLALW